MHQALNRALPIALAVTHFDQFTSEGHGLFQQPQGLTQRRADGNLLRVDVAAPALQAGNVHAQCLVLLVSQREVGTLLNQIVLQRCAAVFFDFLQLHAGLLLRQQVFCAGHLQQV